MSLETQVNLQTKMMDGMQRYKRGVSFVEFTNFCGPEGKGDYMLCLPDHPNIVLWAGFSEDFIRAFDVVRPKLFFKSLNDMAALLIYGHDGMRLTLPFLPDKDEIQPDVDYWLPAVISLKEAQ